jgi:hypothetical protein
VVTDAIRIVASCSSESTARSRSDLDCWEVAGNAGTSLDETQH